MGVQTTHHSSSPQHVTEARRPLLCRCLWHGSWRQKGIRLSPTCLKVVTIEDALKHSEGRVQRQGTWHPLVSRGAGLMPEVSVEVLSIPGLLPSQILGGFLWTRKARQPFSAGLIRRIKL